MIIRVQLMETTEDENVNLIKDAFETDDINNLEILFSRVLELFEKAKVELFEVDDG